MGALFTRIVGHAAPWSVFNVDFQRAAGCAMAQARRCRLAPFKRLATTVKKHRNGILEHFLSGLGSGFSAGPCGRIQSAI
jgi:hypothetical protein